MLKNIRSWIYHLFHQLFRNELIRRIIKNTGYLFSASGISILVGILLSILVGRMLGVAGFGSLGIIITFVGVVNNLASFRMGDLVIKYVGHDVEVGDTQHASAIFKASTLVETSASILAFLLVCLLAPFAASYLLKDSATTGWIILYGVVVLFNLIAESSTGLLQVLNRFPTIAGFTLVQSVVTLGIVVMVFFLHGSMVGVLLAYIIGKAASAIGLTIVALHQASQSWGKNWWQVPLQRLKPQRRELVNFAVSTNLSASISLITKDSELLWVSLFRSPTEAGYYRLALSIANLMQLPVSQMPQATYPELTRQVSRKNWQNVKDILRQSSILAGVYSLIAVGGLIVLGKPLIEMFYGASYLPAYPALVILLIGFLVANVFFWRRNALLALGRPEFPTQLNFILALLKMAGILLLVPVYGYLASASLLSTFFIAVSLISAWKVRQIIRLSQFRDAENMSS